MLIAFISFINNIDKADFFEYPNRYSYWLPKLVPSGFNWPNFTLAFLTLFRMGIFTAANGWRGTKKAFSLPKICHTYPTMMRLGSYTLPKEDPKNIWITWQTPWLLLTSAFFHWKSANFVISRNTDIDCILVHNF